MLNRIINKLKENNIDSFLIKNQKNIDWLCNNHKYYLPGIALVTKDQLFIFTKSRNIDKLKKEYKEYSLIEGGMEKIKEFCGAMNIKTIGFESNYVIYNDFNNLRDLFVGYELIGFTDFIEDIRMIKTDKEIEYIKNAIKLTDRAYLEFLNYLEVGLTEREAKNIFRKIIFSYGADELSFDILLSSGENTFFPHSKSTNRVLKCGDLVLMDFGIRLNGYCSDTTRTVVMKEATIMQYEMYQLVLKTQKEAIKNIKEGLKFKDIDMLARNIIKEKIKHGCFDYGLGHGVGVEVHEKPYIRSTNMNVMKKNMVFSVEPGIYIEDFGGIRIEDLVVVKKDNEPINLSSLSKEFMVLP